MSCARRLTVISGYLDTMADDPSIDQAWAGPIRDMRAQAQRMNAIIADLLELSRLESTDGEAPRDPIDVPRMLERLHRDALAQRRSAAPGAAGVGDRATACSAPPTKSSRRSPICWSMR